MPMLSANIKEYKKLKYKNTVPPFLFPKGQTNQNQSVYFQLMLHSC